MKNLIMLFVIMTAQLFSQGWNNVVQTTIPFDNLVGLDLSSNKDGNHVVVNNHHFSGFPVIHTYTLKYYLLNSSGSVVRSYTFENFQGGNGIQFASIDGSNDRIYVVYKLGNQIKTRKSTNAGQSWSNIVDISIGNNTCNNIDITFGKDDNALHVVWATQDNGSDYETYYSRLPSTDQWDAQKTVTDYGNEVGGFPTVSKSTNRVHVSYNSGSGSDPSLNFGNAFSRDKYQSTWQNPQGVYTTNYSLVERIHAGSSKLLNFYYQYVSNPGGYHANINVKERTFGSTAWSSPVLLQTYADVQDIVSATNTSDGKVHIVYPGLSSVIYRNYNGSSWSSETTIGDYYISPSISSVSNDLFVVWGHYSSYIKYRQYDANPLAPSNFSISTFIGENSGYPKLDWSLNNEPDVRIATNGYLIERRLDQLGDGTWSAWSQIGSVAGSTNTHIDYTQSGAGSGANIAEYRIRAQDITSHLSNYTSALQIQYGTGYWKIGSGIVKNDVADDFQIEQNFPNPFNPSTKINYSVSENSKINIKIYDILGREVAELINEYKEPGFYEINFDGSDLNSGVYIYRIAASNGERILFNQSKQMILIK